MSKRVEWFLGSACLTLLGVFIFQQFKRPDGVALKRDERLTTTTTTAYTPPPDPDLETLRLLAAKLRPTGMFVAADGRPRLAFGKDSVRVGTAFTVTLESEDYVLFLVQITPRTFTLRFREAELVKTLDAKASAEVVRK